MNLFTILILYALFKFVLPLVVKALSEQKTAQSHHQTREDILEKALRENFAKGFPFGRDKAGGPAKAAPKLNMLDDAKDFRVRPKKKSDIIKNTKPQTDPEDLVIEAQPRAKGKLYVAEPTSMEDLDHDESQHQAKLKAAAPFEQQQKKKKHAFSARDVRQGFIMGEILGKPKALQQ